MHRNVRGKGEKDGRMEAGSVEGKEAKKERIKDREQGRGKNSRVAADRRVSAPCDQQSSLR